MPYRYKLCSQQAKAESNRKNRFSISSTGLGESLKRSGGAMATANNTLEETIGLTVAANDAMQDPASTGTALRTIALRLRGMKVE